MPVKVRAKAHPFKDEYADFYCEAAPLSELYARLNAPLDITRARFLIGDEMTADVNRTPPDGSTVYINVVPEGMGNQLKGTGKGGLWAGIGLITAGVIISIASWGTLGGLGAALIGSGAGLAAGGAVLYNQKSPPPPPLSGKPAAR